jgi:DoxX-like protein
MEKRSELSEDAGPASGETRRRVRNFKWAIAFVWLATALSVFHPSYRAIGAHYLGLLGVPLFLMYATCAAEFALGLRVAFGRANRWVTILQVSMIGTFTLLLGVAEPALLVDPLGMLSKNLPMLALIIVVYRMENRGWDQRSEQILRGGMAVIWITEGLFPKMLFQKELELDLVRQSGLVPFDAGTFLVALGAAQVLSGLAVLLFTGRVRKWILCVQLSALLVLPLLVVWQYPELLVHPFGPIVKNVPILVGTWAVLKISASDRPPDLDTGRA